MKPLRVGTENQNKLRELRQMLEPLGFEVLGLDDLPDLHVVEDGATFEQNAVKKAQAVCDATGAPAVADDSGLVVDALGGEPGVHSARYAGVSGPDKDAANRRKLMDAMRSVPDAERAARFVCALVYCAPGREPAVFHGVLEGSIGHEERGHNGFGYDPLFVVPPSGRTAAELASGEKNAISHRGRALRQLVEYLARQPGR